MHMVFGLQYYDNCRYYDALIRRLCRIMTIFAPSIK